MKTEAPIQAVLSGTWHNQHNSEILMEVDGSGKITGYFKNSTTSAADQSEAFPLTGFASGDVFSFCVDFSKYGCMTAWVGQVLDPKDKSFEAMWQMVADAHHKPDLAWKSIWVGQDSFSSGPRGSYVCAGKGPRSHPLYKGII